ncbi:SprT family protein [Salisediminibacterium halotolerans]|uniref:SprT-like protein n=1 Tax=Salisediminibacterium halotolerans TaxID=517425 RepID=A0A1H9SQ08_9BACI|nr:SprT family protein [Salisediminibacterium haloalkalitolerans]SER87102.1 SprT-like protein [Salisediminibacterium haloalkalitolerans]
MTDDELQELTEKLSIEYFQRTFRHRSQFNQKLRTTGGRYLLTTHNIEINPKSYERFGEQELIGIIKHELCHYHLHLEGRGYRHKDPEFQKMLTDVGASRHCKLIEENRRSSNYIHHYRCESCRTEIKRKKRFDTKKYVCGACSGRLKKIKTIPLYILDGK